MRHMEFGCSLYEPEYRHGQYHPVVTAHYYRQWDDFQMDAHRHEAIEIMYVMSGHCFVATEHGRTVRLGRNDFIVLDGGVLHRLLVESNRPCRMMNLEFVLHQRDDATPSLKLLSQSDQAVSDMLSSYQPFLVLKDPNEVSHTLKSLVLELDAEPIHQSVMVDILLAQLLIQVARLNIESKHDKLESADIYVKNAIAYIHHHYDYDIAVSDIASAVNLHPGYLHRIFKRTTGQTITEYLTCLRIEKAKLLLTRTDIPVTEIGESIGLNSSQYFSTLFKKHTGKTPLEYRKSHEVFGHDTRPTQTFLSPQALPSVTQK